MKKSSKDSCNSFLLWHFLAVIFCWFFIIFVLSSFDDDHESNNRNNKAKHPDNWKNHNTLRSFLWWFLFFQFFLFELFKWKPLAIRYLGLKNSSSLRCNKESLGDNRQNLFLSCPSEIDLFRMIRCDHYLHQFESPKSISSTLAFRISEDQGSA